jgi:hypothetical protein
MRLDLIPKQQAPFAARLQDAIRVSVATTGGIALGKHEHVIA